MTSGLYKLPTSVSHFFKKFLKNLLTNCLSYDIIKARDEQLATLEVTRQKTQPCRQGQVANRQTRRAVNPFPSGVVGSTPTLPTKKKLKKVLTNDQRCGIINPSGREISMLPATNQKPKENDRYEVNIVLLGVAPRHCQPTEKK